MIKTYNENKNGNEKENKAILTRNHKKIDELVILNNGLHSSSINVKTGEKKEDLFLRILHRKCNWHKNVFRISVISNPTVSTNGSQVHVRVSRSVKALEIMDAKGDMTKVSSSYPFL